MFGGDANVKVEFLARFVTGTVPGHKTKLLELIKWLSGIYMKLWEAKTPLLNGWKATPFLPPKITYT